MKETEVAERYSRALLAALTAQRGLSLDSAVIELDQLCRLLLSDDKVRRVLENQLTTVAQKKMLVRKAAESLTQKCSPLLLNFLDLVVSKKRMNLLPLILSRFGEAVQKSKGILNAQVKSAGALDARMEKELEQKLSQRFQKQIVLKSSVHPELLAGIVVQVGDAVLDNSLKTRLANLKNKFSE